MGKGGDLGGAELNPAGNAEFKDFVTKWQGANQRGGGGRGNFTSQGNFRGCGKKKIPNWKRQTSGTYMMVGGQKKGIRHGRV